jgi:hypothetical protein
VLSGPIENRAFGQSSKRFSNFFAENKEIPGPGSYVAQLPQNTSYSSKGTGTFASQVV